MIKATAHMQPLISRLLTLRNRHFFALDTLMFLAMPAVALVLRTDGVDAISRHYPSLLAVTLAFLLIKLAIFLPGGLYRRYWRYASVDELANITLLGLGALVAQTLVFFLVLKPTGWVSPDFPRSIPVIDGVLAVLLVGGMRFAVRMSERVRQRRAGREGERVVIAGAGASGVMIAREMQGSEQIGMNPVAFVDDDPDKRGHRILGVPVMGDCADVAKVCAEVKARMVVIAMPTAPGKAIREIVGTCERAGIPTKTVPGMYALLDGRVSVKQLRDVAIEDLLRREPIRTDVSDLSKLIRGKRVLVTGAGGSIGSELCRQVLRYEPEEVLLLGHGENSIFDIQNELEETLKHVGAHSHEIAPQIHSVIADMRFPDRMRAVFEEYRPQVVFHSAAHKHVHLMELNPSEAVTNNVLGTRNVLHCAQAVGTEHFVLISTDKAVNPRGVMGASKRAAELLVHGAAVRTGKPYVAVRFGNVLGSRGSVVLTFQKQIASGGPVTITHPDMERYFITIPEAVQLVMQAAALGRGGEIFMLDMGEPVKIVDLATDLIELSGMELGRDIDIAFTEVRPGEKLVEELFLAGEEYGPTRHEKIHIAAKASASATPRLEEMVAKLESAASRNDDTEVLAALCELVPEFQPQKRTNGKREQPLRLLPSIAGQTRKPVSVGAVLASRDAAMSDSRTPAAMRGQTYNPLETVERWGSDPT